MKVEESLQILIKELKICVCLFVGNVSMCHYLRTSNDLNLGV